MASVYRRTYTRPIPPDAEIVHRKGQRMARFRDRRGRIVNAPLSTDGLCMIVERRCWYISYIAADGGRKTVKGYTDREASEKKGRDLERQASRENSGLQVVDAEKIGASVASALDAYLEDLERLGRSDMYRYTIRKLMEKLIAECNWSTVASIRAEGLTTWLAAAKRSGKSARTLNAYLETPRTFLAWCIDHRYLEGNPLACIKKVDVKTDRRRVRRALTAEQLTKLLDVAGDRRLVYLTAMLTGLRWKELQLLEWPDIVLDGRHPCINLRIGATKAKREDTVPLPPELVEELRSARPSSVGAAVVVFPSMVRLRTYKRDLARAGIDFKDATGRQADFHALRMSYNMLLAREQVPIRTAMRLMRHTDIDLTAQVYTDPTLLDLAGAVEKLPRLMPETTNASGKAESA